MHLGFRLLVFPSTVHVYIVECIYRSGLQVRSKLDLKFRFLWRLFLWANALCTLVTSTLTHLWIKYISCPSGRLRMLSKFIFAVFHLRFVLPFHPKAKTLWYMEKTVQTVNVKLRKCLMKSSQHTLNCPGSGAPRRLWSKVVIYSHLKYLNVNKSMYCFLKLLLFCHFESVPFLYNVLFFILKIW